MINIKINIEEYNTTSAGLEIEHIGQLINQGYTSGIGWTLEGNEEKEPDTIEVEQELPENDNDEISLSTMN